MTASAECDALDSGQPILRLGTRLARQHEPGWQRDDRRREATNVWPSRMGPIVRNASASALSLIREAADDPATIWQEMQGSDIPASPRMADAERVLVEKAFLRQAPDDGGGGRLN